MASTGKHVIVIGLPGLGHGALRRAIDANYLPRIASIIEHGALRKLACSLPPDHIAAWGSISTGQPPEIHGQVYDQELWAGGSRPATRASWRCAPIWETLADRGYNTSSVCWPSTRPGQTWHGVHIDDRLIEPSGIGRSDWPLPLDVSPSDLREALDDCRVHPSEIDKTVIDPIVSASDLSLSGQQIATITHTIARISSLQAAVEIALGAKAHATFIFNDFIEGLAKGLGIKDKGQLPKEVWALLDAWIHGVTSSAETSVIIISPGTAGDTGFMIKDTPTRQNGHTHSPSTIFDIPEVVYSQLGFGKAPRKSGSSSSQMARPSYPANFAPADRKIYETDTAIVAAAGYSLLPTDDNVLLNRLISEAELVLYKNPEMAIELAEESLDHDPSYIPALGIVGSASFLLDLPSKLLTIAHRIEDIAFGHPWVTLMRGGYHAMRNETALANPFLVQAEKSSSIGDAFWVGVAWSKAGQPINAARVFRSIIDQQPHNVNALVGLLLTDTLDSNDVNKILNSILSIDPSRSDIRSVVTARVVRNAFSASGVRKDTLVKTSLAIMTPLKADGNWGL